MAFGTEERPVSRCRTNCLYFNIKIFIAKGYTALPLFHAKGVNVGCLIPKNVPERTIVSACDQDLSSFRRIFRAIFFAVSRHSHEKKSKSLKINASRVQKGKKFPFFCRETSQRPAEKVQTESYFFLLYAGTPPQNASPMRYRSSAPAPLYVLYVYALVRYLCEKRNYESINPNHSNICLRRWPAILHNSHHYFKVHKEAGRSKCHESSSRCISGTHWRHAL